MTTSNGCQAVLDHFLSTLEREFSVENTPIGCVIYTPFVRPDGDQIELLLESAAGVIRVTDMGDTLGYLHVNGYSTTRTVVADVRRIGGRYGVALERNELTVPIGDVSHPAVASPLHSLLQAVMSVANLIEKRRPHARLNFNDEVETAIIRAGRTYDTPFQVGGRNEAHSVRFHVNDRSRLLIQPFSQSTAGPARNLIERWYYHFDDILNGPGDWNIFALLDDRGERESLWTPYVLTPLISLSVNALRWSRREPLMEVLEASAL